MLNPPALDPRTGRLRVFDVQRLERLLGGDPITEELVLQFIHARWGAPNLFAVPPAVAAQIGERPADFLHAAKARVQPELSF